MKTNALIRFATRFLLLISLGYLFSGCETTPKVDWDSRVGTFTYDQAVKELGTPTLTTRMDSGTTAADWPTGEHRAGVGPGGGQTEFLRLTFDQGGVLKSWKQEFR